MEKELKNNKNNKKNKKKRTDGRAEVDLEGEDFYKSTPIVTNYYYNYKNYR